MADPLIGCRAKLDRAREHLEALRGEYDTWFGDGANIIESTHRDEVDANGTLWLVGYCSCVVRQPPPRWGLVVGDAIQNTRAALDHLACRLVEAAGGSVDEATAFPIWSNDPYAVGATPDARRRFERRLRGMHSEDADAIRALQPYHRPHERETNPLAVLRDLSNLDKHRVILPTLMTFSSVVSERTAVSSLQAEDIEVVVTQGSVIAPGVELARARAVSGRPEIALDMGFEMAIAYTGAIHPVRAIDLEAIRARAVDVVESFAGSFAAGRPCATTEPRAAQPGGLR